MKDTFKNGDVIRWTSGGRFTFTALKTPGGWYTSSASYGGNVPSGVPQIPSWSKLAKILQSDDVTDVQYAAGWIDVFTVEEQVSNLI